MLELLKISFLDKNSLHSSSDLQAFYFFYFLWKTTIKIEFQATWNRSFHSILILDILM